MDFLTWENFEQNAELNKGEHWDPRYVKWRWGYHKRAIEIIKRSGTNDPKKVLEMGTMGASIVIGSDTIDYDEDWNFEGQNPTYLHDARKLPWPVCYKQYEWFIALRVFQYLSPVQKECFKEALRIAENVLIVVPDDYPTDKGQGIKLQQFIDWNENNPPKIVECLAINYSKIRINMHLYCWSNNLLKTTKMEQLERLIHLNLPSELLHLAVLSKTRRIIRNKIRSLRNLDN
jgi:hypothetical protein